MADQERNESQMDTKPVEDAKTPAPKKRKKAGIVAAVVVVVLVVAGAGMWVWHEQPSFCGTVCHDTMQEHVDNFYGTDASGGAGQAYVHMQAGENCLSCHEPTLSTQLAEVQAQLTGTYGDLGLSSRYYVDNDKCLSCHGGSYDELAKLTEDLGDYNPHDNPHGQMNCNECHKGHSAQVNTCAQCHDNGGQEMKG